MKTLTLTLSLLLITALPQVVFAQNQEKVKTNEQGQIVEIAGVAVDPGLVQQILAEAGPNPTAQSISAAASSLVAGVADPTPIVAAAMAAASQVGLPNAALINIGQAVVATHAAQPSASSNTVAASAAVVAAVLPPAQAPQAIQAIAAAAAAANPAIDRGQVVAAANVALAQGVAAVLQGAGANQGNANVNVNQGQQGPNPMVMAANVPSGGSGGGGSNQIFNAPTPTPTPASPYGN